jgi:serine/threonine protein kinase
MVERSPEARMTEYWKQWEGQVIAGAFPLQLFLEGDRGHALFLTEYGQGEPQKAVIKIVLGTPESTEAEFSSWSRAAKLSHRNLLRIFTMGRAKSGDTPLVYLAMECADESLAQVIPVRPLTAEEAGQMLEHALSVLAYIHGQGFVHGHVKPEDIMAVGDCLKISIAGLSRVGEGAFTIPDAYTPPEGSTSPAGDIWSLGVSLVEALTQHLPARRPEPVVPETLAPPFLEIARQCLSSDPAARPTAAHIAALLHPAKRPTRKLTYALTAVIALVLSAVIASRFVGHQAAVAPAESAQVPQAPRSEPAPKVQASPPVARDQDEILQRVLPDVPAKASQTIHGRVKVNVQVRVDVSGNVAEATLKSVGSSKYFAGLALQAAQRWRFAPADDSARPREWMLYFEFSRGGTNAASVRMAR